MITTRTCTICTYQKERRGVRKAYAHRHCCSVLHPPYNSNRHYGHGKLATGWGPTLQLPAEKPVLVHKNARPIEENSDNKKSRAEQEEVKR